MVELRFYSGDLLQFVCEAPVVVAPTTFGVVSIEVASNVATVTTSAAHGLYVGAHVTLVSPTAGLSGTKVVASVPSSTTFTFATSGVPDSDPEGDPVVVYSLTSAVTSDPLLTAAVWRVKILRYDETDLISTTYAGGAVSLNYKCIAANRATYL